MSWEKVMLGSVAETCLGKMLDRNKNRGSYQPYLANINVRWGSFDLENLQEMRFEADENERYGLNYGDLVICEGGVPGRCALWRNQIPNMKIQKALHRVRVNDEMDSRYVYYWFLLAGRRGALQQYYTGATIMHMTGQKLRTVIIDKPPLDIQNKISDYLESFDNLIESNQKQIKLLEEAAQRLYKEWFIDLRFPGHENVEIIEGAPEGWSYKALKETSTLKAGGDKPKKFSKTLDKEHFIPVYSNGTVDDGLYGYTDFAEITDDSITISARGSVGYTCIRREPYVPIVRLISIIPRTIDAIYLFLYLKNKTFDSNGAAQQQLTIPMVRDFKVLIPSEGVLRHFLEVMNPIFDKIDILKQQLLGLVEARDRLLPKLMSGEIEV